MRKPVFLSASIPTRGQEGKDPKYWEYRNLLNLREAIREIASVVLPAGPLVFGGHPAITPLILGVADRLDYDAALFGRRSGVGEGGSATPHRDRVLLYQSCYFKKYFPPEVGSFPYVVLTEAVDQDLALLPKEEEESRGEKEQSLSYMRYRMICCAGGGWLFPGDNNPAMDRLRRFGTDAFHAAFFVGGMDGVEMEYDVFRASHPETFAFILPTTGSAARFLFDREKDCYESTTAESLMHDTAYASLVYRLLASCDASSTVGFDFFSG